MAELSAVWKDYETPKRVIIANVASQGTGRELEALVSGLWQCKAEFVVSEASCCGLTNGYRNPVQLGVDRWFSMIAAYHLANMATIVIDCGTAVTVDLVKDDGLFAGGVIMPGLNAALNSLQSATAVEFDPDSFSDGICVTAQSTDMAVMSGVLLGLAGAIESMITEQSSLLGKTPALYITGGDAGRIIPYLQSTPDHQPDLVLQGLQIFATTR
jgi:type III pantothenate kinase